MALDARPPVRISAPASAARPRERVGDRAHAADRHPPLAGAVADQVVEEAAVLDQRGVVHGRRRCRSARRWRRRRGRCRRRSATRSPRRAGARRRRAQISRVDQRRGSSRSMGSGWIRVGATTSASSADLGVERPATRRTRRRRRSASRNDARVASPSGRSTSSPPARSPRVQGVYDAVVRERQPHVEAEVGHQLLRQQARRGRSSARAGPAARRTARRRPRRRRCGRAARARGPRGRRGRGRRRRPGRCGRRRPRRRHSCCCRNSPAQRTRTTTGTSPSAAQGPLPHLVGPKDPSCRRRVGGEWRCRT